MKHIKGFIDFIRTQGVVGLAVSFIMGSSITKLITSFVNNLINPLVGILLGPIGNLANAYVQIGSAKIMFGNFINSLIDFIIIAFVVYFGVKVFNFEKLDKKDKK
jgi:large conductance mechanosensitive channel